MIQSIKRALDILEHTAATNDGTRLVDMAEAIGVNATTASNIVRTLHDLGYLSQTENRRYKLGPRCFALGVAADRWGQLRELSRGVMKEVASKTGDLVFLGARDGFALLCMELVEGGGAIAITRRQLWLDSLHCSATGKVLLAWMPEDELNRYLSSTELERRTPHSIVDPTALRKALERVRAEGVALCKNESAMDVASIGVPIFNGDGEVVASLGQSFPSFFLESGRIDPVDRAATLSKAAKTIGKMLRKKG